MKILFMGTPEFAVPSLKALCDAGHEIVGVFTQPDKPKNRGMKLQEPPVKEFAVARGIAVYQPEKVKDGTALAFVQGLEPELIVVVAYGRILPVEILNEPRLGCINVHSSLLPKYRGSAPIHWAVLNGDERSGVTIMHMAQELDAGDIISQAETAIDPDETVEQLYDRLAQMGAQLLVETIADIEVGKAQRRVQEESQVTFAPMLSRALSPMDFEKPARELHNQVRGLSPWPSAVGEFADLRCKVWKTAVVTDKTTKAPGTVLRADNSGIEIACGSGTVLRILELQAEGKRRMLVADFLRGRPITP